MNKIEYIRLAIIFFLSSFVFQSSLTAQNITAVFAVEDTLQVTSEESVSIDVTCNDYINSDLENGADLIIGDWKLQYFSGGFAGLDPFSSGTDNDVLTFTQDSLFNINIDAGYDFSYEGPYEFTEDYLPGVDLLQLISPSPFLVDDQALLFELSDSILVLSDAAVADSFDKHFVRTNVLIPSILEQPQNGTAVIFEGNLIYSSNAGYVGMDTVSYLVCDTSGLVCDESYAIFNVYTVDVSDVPNTSVNGIDNYYQLYQTDYTFSFNALENIGFDPDTSNITITDIEQVDCVTISFDEISFNVEVTPNTENWNGNNICEFYYVACNQLNNCDTINISLEILCYPWDYPFSSIQDTVLIESYSAEIPLANPCGEAVTYSLESIAVGQAQIQAPVIVYTPPVNYTGYDTLYYYVNELSSIGCIVCGEYVEHIIYVEDGMYLYSVWPGDTNVDGKVNNLDLLPIGLRFGNEGPPRSEEDGAFESMDAQDWMTDFNGLNDKFSDCNGDGTIDNIDVDVINTNYNQTHSDDLAYFAPILPVNMLQPEIDFIGDTVEQGSEVTLIINIGDFLTPVDIYGLAFTLNYDTALIQQNSVDVVYDNSPLNVNNSIVIEKDFYDDSKIDFAISRIDQINSTSTGTVAAVTLIIEENLNGKVFIEKEVVVTISEIYFTLNSGEVYQLGDASASIIATSDIIDSVIEFDNENISLAPNPVKDNLLISTNDLPIELIQIYDISGQLIQTLESINNNRQVLDMSDFKNGNYYLLIKSAEKWHSKRISKISH